MSKYREEVFGDARLILGDCREIAFSLNYDAIVTDPPYGVEFSGKVTKHTDNSGRDDVYPDTPEHFETHILPTIRLLVNHAPRAAIFCGTRRLTEYPKPSDIGGIICPNGGGLSSWGFGCYHPVAFYGRSPYIARGLGARPTATVIYHPGMHVTGENNNPHPCPKPIAFMLWAVGAASLPGDAVLDPFMGSGTTGVAALRLERKFIGIELDERWFDVACRRIEQEARQGRLALAEPKPAYSAGRDSLLSYNAAIGEIGRRVKAGEEPPPTTGYFGSGE